MPDIFIFDLDSTLAVRGDRDVYDWARCSVDTPTSLMRIARCLEDDFQIAVITGRSVAYMEQTEQWLRDHGLRFPMLYMRQEGDTRPGARVKAELVEHLLDDCGWSRIVMAFDDDPDAVEMYLAIGIPAVQVFQGSVLYDEFIGRLTESHQTRGEARSGAELVAPVL